LPLDCVNQLWGHAGLGLYLAKISEGWVLHSISLSGKIHLNISSHILACVANVFGLFQLLPLSLDSVVAILKVGHLL
jgi:hypothetical protein